MVYKALRKAPVDDEDEVGQDVPLAPEVNMIRHAVYDAIEETAGDQEGRVARMYATYMREMIQNIEDNYR